MFKMMSLLMDTGPESLPPFTNGCIDDCLLHIRPHLDQTLFQLIHVTYRLLVHTFLNTTPNLIIDWVMVRAVRRPLVWWYEFRCSLAQILDVARA